MLTLSSLNKTWILDVDGTIVKHNGYLNGEDVLLDGAKDFFERLDPNDKVILLTARSGKYINDLKIFLKNNNIRYDNIIADVPVGERIIVNDEKPSGLRTAFAFNKKRDEKFEVLYKIDENL